MIFKLKYVYIYVFILLFLIPFFWFENNFIYAGGEGLFVLNPNVNFHTSIYTWNLTYGFGLPNIYISSVFYYTFTNVLSTIFSLPISQKIMFGLSFGLSFLFFYKFLKYIFKGENYEISYVFGSILYSINPFSITMFPWFPTYGFLFVVGPLIILNVLRYFKEQKLYQLTPLILVSCLALNIALLGIILILIIFFSFIQLIKHKDQFKLIIKLTLTFVLLNAFWILPFSQIYKSLFNNAKVYETNFSNVSLIKNPVLNSFTLTGYYWFDKINPTGQLYYQYSNYYKLLSQYSLLILLIIVILSTLFSKNRQIQFFRAKFNLHYFIFLFLIGVFASKGGAYPFGFIYQFALNKIRIFGIYRSADIKFPYITIFAFSVLLTYFIILVNKRLYKIKYLVIINCLIACVIGLLTIPFLSGELMNKKQHIQVPQYWNSLATHININPHITRILLFPVNYSPFDKYSWGYDGGWLSASLNNKSSIAYTDGYGPSLQESRFNVINKIYRLLENKKYADFFDSLEAYGISHILYRGDFDLNQKYTDTNYYPVDDIKYQSGIKNVLDIFFKKKVVFGKLNLYDVSSVKKTSSSTGFTIEFVEINPTKYIVKLRKFRGIHTINFLQSFDEKWQLYRPESGSPKIYKDQEFEIGDIKYLFEGPIFNDSHKLFLGYANSWTIDSENLKKTTPKSNYVDNVDGSIDINLVINYKPQAYLYFGYLISFITFFLCLISYINNIFGNFKDKNVNV